MAKLKEIVGFLDEYLEINEFEDRSWNGLQFEGKSEVKKILFAVDAGIETFQKAVEEKADMIIVHHGHFWKTIDPSIRAENKERMNILFKNEISLYGAHLPLDSHKEVGNNAQLLKIMGAKIKEEFGDNNGKKVSWLGELEKEKSFKEIEEIINKKLGVKSKALNFGKEKIKTIAVCSGGGGYPTFAEALSKKVDLYLTGDSMEVYHLVKDSKFNVIFAGHHTTETIGIKALSDVVSKKFEIETIFVDIPTGL